MAATGPLVHHMECGNARCVGQSHRGRSAAGEGDGFMWVRFVQPRQNPADEDRIAKPCRADEQDGHLVLRSGRVGLLFGDVGPEKRVDLRLQRGPAIVRLMGDLCGTRVVRADCREAQSG